MRILFLTAGGETEGSARVRLLQFRPALDRDVGRTSALAMSAGSPLSIRARQAAAVALAWRADVVVVQRMASPVLSRSLARVNRRVIYDVDDAVYEGSREVEQAFGHYERIVVGNRLLADHVQRFNPNVTVIPSVVDESRFPLADRPPRPAGGPVVVGWIGHQDNMVNLTPLRPAFEALERRSPGRVVLKVVSGRPFDFGPGGPAVVNKPWRLADEAADVRSFDVGLMPLADTPWNRHKCAYKALLYMSQSVPTVVSPVGVNADIVRDGVNGFHATTADDWADRIGRLAGDPAVAGRLGPAGRRTIAEGFTVAAVLPTWAAVLRGEVRPGRSAAAGVG